MNIKAPFIDELLPYRRWRMHYTPVIPTFYWDSVSPEQQILELCRQWDAIIKYEDLQTAEVNEIVRQVNEMLASFDDKLNDDVIAAVQAKIDDGTFTPLLEEAITRWMNERSAQVDQNTRDIELHSQRLFMIDEAIEKAEKFTKTTDLGFLSDFRFALRAPEGFNIPALLSAAEKDLADFKTYNWNYQQVAETTIPLMQNSPSYVLQNQAGAVVSCSSFVTDCLYKAGYSDLAGISHYMTLPENNLRDFLLEKGWTEVSNISDLQAGDVVASSWRRDSNNLFLPGHTFIYAGNNEKYDAGSQSLISGGVKVACNWNTGLNQLDRLHENGLYSFVANRNMQYTDNASERYEWKVLVNTTFKYVPNILRDGYHTGQIAWCFNRYAIRMSDDNLINWTQVFPGTTIPARFSVASGQSFGNTETEISLASVSNPNFSVSLDGNKIKFNKTGNYRIDLKAFFTKSTTEQNVGSNFKIATYSGDTKVSEAVVQSDHYIDLHDTVFVNVLAGSVISFKASAFNTSQTFSLSNDSLRTRIEVTNM